MRPGPIEKSGTKPKKTKAARTSKVKIENVAYTKQPAIAEGVRMCVENLLDPKSAQLLPCGTGARVFPTYYHREEVLIPEETEKAFNGVAVLRPHRNNFLTIDVDNGPKITQNAVNIAGTDLVDKAVIYQEGVRYSPVFQVKTTTGVLLAKSVLRPVLGEFRYFGQDDTGKWVEGYVNVVESRANTSSNLNYTNLVFQPVDTNVNEAVDISIGEINLSDGTISFGVSVSLAAGASASGPMDNLTGTHTGFLTYFCEGSTEVGQGQLFKIKSSFTALDVVDLDSDIEIYPPTPEDEVYNTLTEHSTKYRLDAMSLLFQFRGSDMSNAGSVAIALVPEGTNLPLDDPEACYAAISKLPYDKYTGPIKKGAHCFWRPATLRELLFTENGYRDPQLISNFIVVAWLSPATTAGQPPQVSIKVDSIWEWIFDSQSLPQYRAPFGWAFLEAMYCIISQYNPAGENPDHLRKIKAIAKAAANNPVLRKLGTDALQLGIESAKKLLPALMGGLLV